MKFAELQPDRALVLPKIATWPAAVHVFDQDSIWALKTAVCANRPLLIRGEPGCGKSQLARAAAQAGGMAFISKVINSQTEASDLQWRFDAVARLGAAQARASGGENAAMDPGRFLGPGPMWWALDWTRAEEQVKCCKTQVQRPYCPPGWSADQGMVILIDEIDKAESDLPNGLLETLGNGAFSVPYLSGVIELAENTPPPLIIITTNEDRALPAAFLRRCLVLQMALPEDEVALSHWLVARGKVHFGKKCRLKVRQAAAAQLGKDRRAAQQEGLIAPGQAEYLDLLRALAQMARTETEQLDVLDAISKFAFKKMKRR